MGKENKEKKWVLTDPQSWFTRHLDCELWEEISTLGSSGQSSVALKT
jgi:hypothetical protein